MEKKRIIFLDAIKAVSILLVVFCHYITLPSETVVGNAIMSLAWAAVPCFFMVTGSLLHNKKEFSMKKDAKKIIFTYFITSCWKLLYLLFYFVIAEVNFSKAELFNYLFLFGNIDGVNIGHMWFMYSYMLVLVFFPISYYIVVSDNKIVQLYTGILLFLGSIGINTMHFLCTTLSSVLGINPVNIKALNTVIPFGGYINMLFYFFLGGILFKNRDAIVEFLRKKFSPKPFVFGLIVVGILGNMAIKYSYTNSFRWQGIYLSDGYNSFFTMLMSLGIYILFLILQDNRMFGILAKYVGEETMGIYFLHMPILHVCSILIYPYLKPYYSVSLNIVKTVIIVIICVIITEVIKKIPCFRRLVQ